MSGATDPIYIAARTVLLDALEALADHRASLVLIGAQEIVGIWAPAGEQWATVDLLVPAALAGRGGRGAELPGHDDHAVRQVRGIEGCVIDVTTMMIMALRDDDHRRFDIGVAGPAALMVAKCHKLNDRLGETGRRRPKPKDAHDVLRLLRGVPTTKLADGFARMFGDPVSREIAREGLDLLGGLFGRARAQGSLLAADAAEGLEDRTTVAASCEALTNDLVARVPRT